MQEYQFVKSWITKRICLTKRDKDSKAKSTQVVVKGAFGPSNR
jgi:hypothetical protein